MIHLDYDYIEDLPLESPVGVLTLAELLTSRICHDLISPLGAIGNGVELMSMAGVTDGPELALIGESVETANARIRLFRCAFGAAAPGQMIPRAEIMSLMADYGRITRHWTEFEIAQDLPRQDVKLLLLLLMCLETALPWGGAVHVTRSETGYTLVAEADRIRHDAEQWAILSSGAVPEGLRPVTVHFIMGALELRRQGCGYSIKCTEQTMELALSLRRK
ncbi:histidine phosphotransferase family protein [Roseinatronobacter sp. S2]|uniref:histidine phosphotransferase family protein n=1 Tax=Roseinatronobacter sp. S2 TaxID=3035471 RepID=UPI00240F68DC|nr:histidine phosphotransferase family protein [Roseinatronobacter sp. S2]WFE75226.1 histidine phosphotransferase family protein [Roseinatronobacter sp. S2]